MHHRGVILGAHLSSTPCKPHGRFLGFQVMVGKLVIWVDRGYSNDFRARAVEDIMGWVRRDKEIEFEAFPDLSCPVFRRVA